LSGAQLTVVAYVVTNGVRHCKLRCLACQRLSRTSLPQRLLDYPTMAQAPAMLGVSPSQPGFFCDHCGGADVETHHRAPRSLFPDYNAWPTAQLCPTRHALRHDVVRAGAWRL
jgi:hypothetical protein